MTAPARPSAVFLHTGWRSCGTWIWAHFRESPSVRAFYEPLHEDLATITRPKLGAVRPSSWKSGHSNTAAYFAEYEALLSPDGRGVVGYRQDFAFENYFMEPDEHSPALEAYLRSLLDSAHAEGRMPVLKFCRSLGRVAWLRRRFPGALHINVLRDPVAQWESSLQQYVQYHNRYFLLAPFMILSRNARHPLVADALTRLDVPLPPDFGPYLTLTVDACWRHVKRLNWDERYRGFLACWTASAAAALQSDSLLIESTALNSNPAYRTEMAGIMSSAAGIQMSLEPLAGQSFSVTTAPKLVNATADMALANYAALGFAAAHAASLPGANKAVLMQKLTEAPGLAALVALPNLEHRSPRPAARNRLLQYLDAALYITALRLSFPLRRLHGELDRLWAQRRNARRGKRQIVHQPSLTK